MDEVSRSGVVRSVISWRNVQQNTVRIARTARKVLISRDFVRAVLSRGIDRQWTVTERHDKYRPRIDRQRSPQFAGLLSSTRSPRSVRSVS
jgi:hypothetical protein